MLPKKLLVLDVNGLLVDTYFHKEPLPEESPDARVGNFYVYKRPFCDEFLHFCLDNFTVGIWSSAREYNVNNLVDYVFGDSKEELAFSWHQSDCTDVGLKAPDNQWKPLFMKELSKLWRKVKVGLPWSEGDYGPSNTLLVDDTPYKAILNPPNTAIFPRSYTARDHGDNFLGDSLRSYLEGIREAASVQMYVESNPFGEPSITPESPLWSYVSEVLLKVRSIVNKMGNDNAQAMPGEAICEEVNKRDKHKRHRLREQHRYLDPLQLEDKHTQSPDNFPSEAVQSSQSMLQPFRRGVHACDPTSTYQQDKAAASLDIQEIADTPLDDIEQVHMAGSLLVYLNQPSKDQESLVGSSSLKRKRGLSEDVERAQKPLQNGKEISLTTKLKETYRELSEDEQPGHEDRSNSHMGLGEYDRAGGKDSENTGFSSSPERAYPVKEQAATTTRGADKQHVVGKQSDIVERTNHNRFDKFVHNGGQHHSLEAGIDGNSICKGNENFKELLCIPVRDSSLSPSKPGCMQAENNMQAEDNYKELPCRRQEMITPGDNGFRFKHRRPQGEHDRWHNKRNDSNFSYGQGWKSKTGYYQDGATRTPPFKGRDGRRHSSVYNQHPTDVDRRNTGRGYPNRDEPSFGYARHCQQKWDGRPLDTPAEYAWGLSTPVSSSWERQEWQQFPNTMASSNARYGVYDSPFSTQSYKRQRGISVGVPNYDEVGKVDGGGSSSYLGHHGYEQGAVYESSNVWPERTEQLNVHIPDSSNLAVKSHDWWDNLNGKRWRRDVANKGAGASNQPHRNVGASHKGGFGVSRQEYRGVGASKQPYHHDARPRHRQGWPSRPKHGQEWPSREFSRNRQSQEGRNL